MQRLECLGRIVVARLNAHHVQVLLCIARIGCKEHRPAMGETDHQAVVPGGMTHRFKQEDAFGYFLVPRKGLKARRVHVRGHVGCHSRCNLAQFRRETDVRVRQFLVRGGRFQHIELASMT